MDPFTQRMLEKAEQRSRALGISNASQFPLGECGAGAANIDVCASGGDALKTKVASPQRPKPQQIQQKSMQAKNAACSSGSSSGKLVLLDKATLDASPTKPLRHFAAVNKENMDLGIEINITTDKPIGVQVEIQEQDMTDDESGEEKPTSSQRVQKMPVNPPLRDTSRSRLQRLGALYSNTADLSSPIHRTEERFHAGNTNDGDASSSHVPKQRLGKLTELADTINQWEDDTSHHNAYRPLSGAVPPPKPDLSSRQLSQPQEVAAKKKPPAPQPPTQSNVAGGGNKTKQLKWDPKVMSSLEAQGFQRRESSTVKHTYDYAKDTIDDEATKQTTVTYEVPKTTAASQVAKPFTKQDEKKSATATSTYTTTVTSAPNVKSGLVSGRTAIFENKVSNINQQQTTSRPQKDPCELPLKDRMKLFETGNNKAVLPKAPIGSAPSLSQIRQGLTLAMKRDEVKAPISSTTTTATTITPAAAAVAAPLVKTKADSKLRDKVAALVANAQSSAESRIKDIDKQRQEDMQIIANRFNKQKDIYVQHTNAEQHHQSGLQSKIARPMPPPPPPPMDNRNQCAAAIAAASSKRRSPGDAIDEETKRARKSTTSALGAAGGASAAAPPTTRLYPALADLDSSEDNGCETVTASVSDGATQPDEQESYMDDDDHDDNNDDDDDDDDESDVSRHNDEQKHTEDSNAVISKVGLGREVMQVVQQAAEMQHTQQRKKMVHYADRDYYFGNADEHDSSMNSSSLASMGVDDYLDEALEDHAEESTDDGDNFDDDVDDDDGDDDNTQNESANEEETNRLSRGSKGTTASNSFTFRKTSSKYVGAAQPIAEDQTELEAVQTPILNTCKPVTSELKVNQDNENLVTLVHTVSFYRRQQSANSANSTPVRKICREQQVLRSALDAGGAKHKLEYDSPQRSDMIDSMPMEDVEEEAIEDDAQDEGAVQDKIKKLLDEVCKQQQVIGQASQALNLCAATIEFSGSTESVEGERYLLLATHRRQACLDEVQRLRVENSLRPTGAPRERGMLTIRDITIPLRQEYVRKMASDTITGHHLVCLLKYNEHVLATKTVPTMPGLLSVKFPDVLQLNNVFADFRITLEIYGMLAQRDQLPHELKYHINLNKKGGIKTPKKKGASDNRLVMPPVQSPAGPNAVRTPQLVQYGFAIFSMREIQRTIWTLTQVLGVSPLEGVLHMKVNCELSVSVEYKGFLTMFEDISGFGAWHRRWCYLSGSVLSYWKYPDDEKKKMPMGSIELNACVSQKVAVAPRDVCARLNTILLECQRPAKDTDQESLIIVPNGRTTIVRHLLSADTKEEREEWCAYINKSLTLLRAWSTAP